MTEIRVRDLSWMLQRYPGAIPLLGPARRRPHDVIVDIVCVALVASPGLLAIDALAWSDWEFIPLLIAGSYLVLCFRAIYRSRQPPTVGSPGEKESVSGP